MKNSNNSEIKKFGFDISLTFFSSTIYLFLLFLTVVFLGRYLGPEDLGRYRLITTIYGIVILFSAIGLPTAVVKYVAEFKDDNQKIKEIVSSGIILSILLGLVTISIFYLWAGYIAGLLNISELEGLIKLLLVALPFSLIGGILLGLLNGLREMRKFAASSIFQNLLMFIITIILVLSGFGINGAVLGLVISTIGGSLFTIFLSKEYLKNITFRSIFTTSKTMLVFGSQIFILAGIDIINHQTDIILIGFYLSAGDVGHYSAAIGFSKFFWLVPNAIRTITYPAASEYWNKGNLHFLNKMIDKSMRYTTFIITLLGLGVFFFTEQIITISFGTEFLDAVDPLRISIIGVVILGIVKSISSTLSGVGRPDLGVKAYAIGAIINVILNILLIPRYGISGAAIATTISFIVVSFASLYFMYNYVHIKINIIWYAKILVIILIVILLFMLGLQKMNIYIIGTVALISYILIFYIFLLNKDDKDTFKTFIDLILIKFKIKNHR